MKSINELVSDSGENCGLLQELYDLYLKDPALVDQGWADYFKGLGKHTTNGHGAHTNGAVPSHSVSQVGEPANASLQEKAGLLVDAYRRYGHLRAKNNPLSAGVTALPDSPLLNPEHHGISKKESASSIRKGIFGASASLTLGELLEQLQKTYCGAIGFEVMHVASEEERSWLLSRIEAPRDSNFGLSSEERRRAFINAVEAEEFEAQLHKKYVGHKRFSLQGGETLIPMLDYLLEECASLRISEVVMGMAHRGRLNVLCNTVGKPLSDIFKEFEDQSVFSVLGSGDVKYHKGYRSIFSASNGSNVEVMLAPNPSHLEFVDPVVVGIARAKQDALYKRDRNSVMAVLMHGDAAFAGQGVVFETFNLAQLEGYKTGGTIHIIQNNQIGFTTNPDDARSCTYASDLAKAFSAPVFHCNGENVEACLWTIALAVKYRAAFGKDVVVDLVTYRKYGHNEGDDPSFTQPLAYQEINAKKSIARLFGEKLVAEKVLREGENETIFNSYQQEFHSSYAASDVKALGEACSVLGRLRIPTPDTTVSKKVLEEVAHCLVSFPETFVPHPKLKNILEKRVATLGEGAGIDWGFAETLAYGSLMLEGYNVRLSGQDCGRGTFSHRHLALNHFERPERFYPLSTLSRDHAPYAGIFEVLNSPLSEAAVLGFEFGYAAALSKTLVLWEAQFGDFSNGAQVHIDQFIAGSEAKWDQLCGVVMLLPHGYEGQGPEHSSARLERFLQLCGEGNMVVCYPSNAAQIFHLLRRQGKLEQKRPLVVMTPKSLLRLPDATCKVDQLTQGGFQTIIVEDCVTKGSAPSHVVMLSGKIYYEALAAIKKLKNPRVRVVRVEQLHPFPQYELKKAIKDIKAISHLWVQEEPKNMGAWTYLEEYLREKFEITPIYVGRPAAASPATGSTKRHAKEQQEIIDEMISYLERE